MSDFHSKAEEFYRSASPEELEQPQALAARLTDYTGHTVVQIDDDVEKEGLGNQPLMPICPDGTPASRERICWTSGDGKTHCRWHWVC